MRVKPTATGHPKGRRSLSLQLRLVVWTLALLVTTTIAYGGMMHWHTRQLLVEQHLQATAVLGNSTAEDLTGRLQEDSFAEVELDLQRLASDPNVAFVIVRDPSGELMYQHTPDSEAYGRYVAQAGRKGSWRPVDALGLSGQGADWLEVFESPVWDRPMLTFSGFKPAGARSRELQGYLVLGLKDAQSPRLLGQMMIAQLCAVGIVWLIALPLVLILARRWSSPLRTLTKAMFQLANRETPEPVTVRSNDEVGALSQAFNVMTSRLLKVQRELQQSNYHLEEKVSLRTEQLQSANTQLERLIKDKDAFLRAVSHDLGAPLRNIAGLAQMIVHKHEAHLGEDMRHKLERIIANADQQSAMIDELLELSKIRTRPGHKQAVDLNELIAATVDSLSYDLQEARIRVEVAEGLPEIYVEPLRIRQVFQNLIDNAVKYMGDSPDRRIVVGYAMRQLRHEFTVTDTGRGIAEQDLDQVFEVFRRATKSGPLEAVGRGVGLSTVKTIIESYGGVIEVESELGQGTTFRFTLDVSVVSAPDPNDPEQHKGTGLIGIRAA